jgi:hypothetical protein
MKIPIREAKKLTKMKTPHIIVRLLYPILIHPNKELTQTSTRLIIQAAFLNKILRLFLTIQDKYQTPLY